MKLKGASLLAHEIHVFPTMMCLPNRAYRRFQAPVTSQGYAHRIGAALSLGGVLAEGLPAGRLARAPGQA